MGDIPPPPTVNDVRPVLAGQLERTDDVETKAVQRKRTPSRFVRGPSKEVKESGEPNEVVHHEQSVLQSIYM
jgi:hypothetical protein